MEEDKWIPNREALANIIQLIDTVTTPNTTAQKEIYSVNFLL